MPDPNNTVVKIDIDLTKPITVFIQKVAKTTGVLYEPRRIKKNAQAEAEAMLIIANANAETLDISERAKRRVELEEIRSQSNIESIVKEAIPNLTKDSDPDKIDDDWLSYFFNKSKLTSDEDIQKVWANILSGEANSPGTFTKRTINFLSEMDTKDAEMFMKIANINWKITDNYDASFVFNENDQIFTDNGVNYSMLQHLDSLNLIKYTIADSPQFEFQNVTIDDSVNVKISYQNSKYTVNIPKGIKKTLEIGRVTLTKQGEELINICKPERVDGLEEYIIEKFTRHGYKLVKIT